MCLFFFVVVFLFWRVGLLCLIGQQSSFGTFQVAFASDFYGFLIFESVAGL